MSQTIDLSIRRRTVAIYAAVILIIVGAQLFTPHLSMVWVFPVGVRSARVRVRVVDAKTAAQSSVKTAPFHVTLTGDDVEVEVTSLDSARIHLRIEVRSARRRKYEADVEGTGVMAVRTTRSGVSSCTSETSNGCVQVTAFTLRGGRGSSRGSPRF